MKPVYSDKMKDILKGGNTPLDIMNAFRNNTTLTGYSGAVYYVNVASKWKQPK